MKKLLFFLSTIVLISFSSCSEPNSPSQTEEDVLVDLGLPSGLKWAKYNVGASSPEDYGYYLSWYQVDSMKTELGDHWHVPSVDELTELISECTWKWSTMNKVNGYVVTGPNGKSIFLPAAGRIFSDSNLRDQGERGHYWSSTIIDVKDAGVSNFSYALIFAELFLPQVNDGLMGTRQSVRLVCK